MVHATGSMWARRWQDEEFLEFFLDFPMTVLSRHSIIFFIRPFSLPPIAPFSHSTTKWRTHHILIHTRDKDRAESIHSRTGSDCNGNEILAAKQRYSLLVS